MMNALLYVQQLQLLRVLDLFYLFIYLFASDTHNLDYMYPYQLLAQ